MNHIIGPRIERLIQGHWSLLSLIDVSAKAPIHFSFESWYDPAFDYSNVRKNRVDHHCLNDFHSDFRVPHWHVIMKGAPEMFRDGKGGMLYHIGVDKKQKKASVEELSNKYPISYTSQLLWHCVFSNPNNESDYKSLQDHVDCDDNESHCPTKDLSGDQFVMIYAANGLSILHWLTVYHDIGFKHRIKCWRRWNDGQLLAKALHRVLVVSWLTGIHQAFVTLVLFESIWYPKSLWCIAIQSFGQVLVLSQYCVAVSCRKSKLGSVTY